MTSRGGSLIVWQAAGALMLALLAIAAGVAVPLVGWLDVLVIAGLLIAVALAGHAGLGRPMMLGHGVLVLVGVCVVLGPAIQSATGLPGNALAEVMMFVVASYSVRHWRSAWSDRAFRFYLIGFSFALLLALLSTVVEEPEWKAVVYQFLFNLKFPLMVLTGYAFSNRSVLSRSVLYAVSLILGANLILAFAQVVFPDSMAALFPYGGLASRNPLFGGELPRAVGFFFHSGLFVAFSSFCFLVGLMALFTRGSRDWGVAILILSLLCMVLSGQRQEPAALMISCVLLYICYQPHGMWARSVIAALTILTVLAPLWSFVLHDPLMDLVYEWGLVGNQFVVEPRAVMFRYGYQIANELFPLGSGLGSFGSVGAATYDLSIYQELGFGRFWWFVDGKWLNDTYWPNIIAECGWIGAVALVVGYLALCGALLVRFCHSSGEVKFAYGLAGGGLAFLLVSSLTSPIVVDPNYAWLFLLPIGMAFGMSRRTVCTSDGSYGTGASGRTA